MLSIKKKNINEEKFIDIFGQMYSFLASVIFSKSLNILVLYCIYRFATYMLMMLKDFH